MPLVSSPVAYPPSSSPVAVQPRKRRKLEEARSPLQDVDGNRSKKVVGGFLLEDSDEEDIAIAKTPFNKRKLAASVDEDLSQNLKKNFVRNSLFEVHNQPNDSAAIPEVAELLVDGRHRPLSAVSASGKTIYVGERRKALAVSYEQLIAARSTIATGKAQRSYYGVDIHSLLDEAKALDEIDRAAKVADANALRDSVEEPHVYSDTEKPSRTLMWTEKYRAKKFTDLVGDERTHRSVLRWLKTWDPIVFPGATASKPKAKSFEGDNDEQRHCKVLLLTGPPGLGKTTLAHVCARQAGYEVQEINASDERSHNVVKGRIKDMVGTENVRGVDVKTLGGRIRKAGKPVCVVVDEVDGVVSGSSGGGEGGFIKALVDLVNLDHKNSNKVGTQQSTTRNKKGEKFRMLRPMILICNDVYHPSLRPLRQHNIAEIIHIRKPPLNMVISRMHSIFDKEGVQCEADGVRRLCEATWGVSTRKEGGIGNGSGEGDIRGVMVVGEWVAGRLRASVTAVPGTARLTRAWVEEHLLNDLAHGGGAARSIGRGGPKEIAERVFKENAGFPKTAAVSSTKRFAAGTAATGVAESEKSRAMDRLGEMANTCGDIDRIVLDCFTSYPNHPYQDDTYLTKPMSAYSWLDFHDHLSTAVHGSQEWELAPYLAQSILAFHHLFATSSARTATNPAPSSVTNGFHNKNEDEQSGNSLAAFSGPGAYFAASEAQRANRGSLVALQSSLSLPLTRMFRSPEDISTELLPFILRMLAPTINPVIVNSASSKGSAAGNGAPAATASIRKASEKALVRRAVCAMTATGVRFEKARVELDPTGIGARATGGWVYRMEPALDELAAFETLGRRADDKVRFGVRQVLDTEWRRETRRLEEETRKRRGGMLEIKNNEYGDKEGQGNEVEVEKKTPAVKRDFFGRMIVQQGTAPVSGEENTVEEKPKVKQVGQEKRVWVSFHEGFSNAVRKPLTLAELMKGF